jgi:hypothetical protein
MASSYLWETLVELKIQRMLKLFSKRVNFLLSVPPCLSGSMAALLTNPSPAKYLEI